MEVSMSDDKDSSKRVEPSTAATLTIDAELIDTGEPAPRPGDMYIVSLMLYKVLNVVRETYSHPFILVGHYVPNLSSSEFRIGIRHRLHLTREFPPHASILNKFKAEELHMGIFYCPSFEVIK
jgi:hypothetical protein